ncbi:MAG: hypothetical protein JWQ22_3066 [Devosia sp.]|nr:hypothetical protein [Devosia sp.]
MERQSQVLEVLVEHQGHPHSTSYFVERNIIFANIGGRVLMAPVGPRPAADTVKTLLLGHLTEKMRKRRLLSQWSNV